MNVDDIYNAKALLESSLIMPLEMMMVDDGYEIAIYKWLCQPKAELKTKHSTKRHRKESFLTFWYSTLFTRRQVHLMQKTVYKTKNWH